MGLGDIVSWLIRVVTFGFIKECDDCRKKKEWLNKIRLWKKCDCEKKRPCDCEKKKEDCDCEKASQV